MNKVLKKIDASEIINGEYVVPEGIEVIDEYAFADVLELTSVKLPSTLKTINRGAFSGCFLLKSVEIPDGVKEIDDNAFSSCRSLSSIKIPDSVEKLGEYIFSECVLLEDASFPKNMKRIPSGTFYKCEKLKKVEFPENLEEIEKLCFYNCSSLESVDIPKTVYSIESKCFEKCYNLKNIVLPPKVVTIYSSTFADCMELENITFSEDLEYILGGAFMSCKSLKSVIIPDKVRIINQQSFSNCINLEKVKLPKKLEYIDANLFYNCEKLKSITIPDSVSKIGKSAFSGTGLEKIIIPDSVEKIETSAFEGCSSLKDIKLPEGLKVIEGKTFKNCTSLGKAKDTKSVYYLYPNGEVYSRYDKYNEFVIPESVTEIESEAFSGCESLVEVKLPSEIRRIGRAAFFGCEKLEEMDIPETVNSVDDRAFMNCYNLQSVKLPSGVVNFGEEVFYSCENLVDVNLPKYMLYIPNGFFRNCLALPSISIPSGVREIGDYAFTNCGELESIELPENVDSIGQYAFNYCKSIKSFIIPDGVKEIKESTFLNCENLESVYIPEDVVSIGESAFSGCGALKQVTLPKNIGKIPNYLFRNCYSLNNLDIPESVTSIGTSAFYGCSSLNSVNIPQNVYEIGDDVFGNTLIMEQHFPKSIISYPKEKIGDALFFYFTKTDDGFILSEDKRETSLPLEYVHVDLAFLSNYSENSKELLREQSNYFVCDFINSFLTKLPEDKVRAFLNSHNFTFFKQIIKQNENEFRFDIDNNDYMRKDSLYRALYNLGVFEPPYEQNGKIINPAQKISVFLQSKLGGELNLKNLASIFSTSEITGYKKEFTDFFIDNLTMLLFEESNKKGFIARCYNEFEKVQKTNTNDHGRQRQLKATVEKFKDYFNTYKYQGITPENVEIARTIGPFFAYQEDFDHAVEIDEERKQKGTPDNILSKPLKESDVFGNIDEYAKKCEALNAKTLGLLTKLADNEFSFEWLQKNDPQNFILGKLCSCCAHLSGVGYGIMRASIVDPNVQNMVIRNESGEIIAKATLYVNPQEGYGVINTVQINTAVNLNDKKFIYDKFILGVRAFANQYNLEHKDKPLKQINVGMGLNDLESLINENLIPSSRLLDSINYTTYGIENKRYAGDSFDEQFIVWKADESKNNSINPVIEKN